MRSEGPRPTGHVRETMVAGQMAELVALPVLLAVVVVFHAQLRWGYLGGAIACVFASLLCFALFLALTRGAADRRAQELISLVMSSLAVATLGLLELGTSVPFGTLLPGCLVVVVFMGIVGDPAMRTAVDCVAVGTVAVVGWADGLGADQLAAVTLVYATSVVLITWLTSRAVASLGRRRTLRRPAGALDDALGGGPGTADARSVPDSIGEVLSRGLPVVPEVMPAERISVFARNADSGHFVAVATWPDGAPEVCPDPASRPEVVEAVRTDRVVIGDELCVVPIGYCSDGALVMVVRRSPGDLVDRRAGVAEAVAHTFLRATSRANFLNGLGSESRTDVLTGLPGRPTLFERIEIEMEHALRSDSPLSVAMIDLDHFRQYNDDHGPVAGDTLLRSIAALVVSNIRGQDLVVRYGGEEFCLVMPDTDILGAHHLLDKLRDGGREATSQFGVTLSAGITSWDGVEDTASMIERADQALYRAKQTGRNRVVSIQSVTEY